MAYLHVGAQQTGNTIRDFIYHLEFQVILDMRQIRKKTLGQGNRNEPNEYSWSSVNSYCVELLPWWKLLLIMRIFLLIHNLPVSQAKQKYQPPSSVSCYQERSLSQAVEPAVAAFWKQPPAPTESLPHFSWHCSIAEWMDSGRGIDTRQLWRHMQTVRTRTA